MNDQQRHIANCVSFRGSDFRSLTLRLDAADFELIERLAKERNLPTGTCGRQLLHAAVHEQRIIEQLRPRS